MKLSEALGQHDIVRFGHAQFIPSMIADLLDSAERQGSAEDVPEGARYITISDSAARAMASSLRAK